MVDYFYAKNRDLTLFVFVFCKAFLARPEGFREKPSQNRLDQTSLNKSGTNSIFFKLKKVSITLELLLAILPRLLSPSNPFFPLHCHFQIPYCSTS
jgi:hypothetical protein